MAKEIEVATTAPVHKRMELAPHLQNPKPLPEPLAGLFTIQDWLLSLTKGIEYKEPNPDYMQQRMMMLTLSATTVEELLGDQKMDGLQELIPNVPWASTGNIVITDLYVAASDQKEGNRTYMLLTYFNAGTGEETTTTTGATKLQLQFASLLAMGVWPIEGRISRIDRKDRGDRYLFSFYPVE